MSVVAPPGGRDPTVIRMGTGSDAIPARAPRRSVRWGLMLTVLARFLAVLWILRSLTEWALILGATPDGPLFEDASRQTQAVVVSLAVLHTVVGVGLWLSWGWGGVLWLIAVAAEVAVYVLLPGTAVESVPQLLFFGLFAAIYLGMTLLERKENR